MSSPKFEIFEMYALEHNSRILKASENARILRGLPRKNGNETRQSSLRVSRTGLVNFLTSLIPLLRRQPA